MYNSSFKQNIAHCFSPLSLIVDEEEEEGTQMISFYRISTSRKLCLEPAAYFRLKIWQLLK